MHVDVKTIVKGALGEALAYRYHRNHKGQAARILKSLEPRFGRPNPADVKRAGAYAREVLGHEHYAPWLHVYTVMAGSFREGWIPDNYYGLVVVPRINGLYGKVSHLKLMANVALHSDVFPDVAYHVNGLFLAPDYSPIPAGRLKERLFADCDRIAFKVDTSRQGKGILFFTPDDFDAAQVASLGNGVFQSYITQHPFFERFTSKSVATLRITTAVDDAGLVTVRACYLRLGRGDDTHVQSRSHVRVPIDPASGAFAREGFLASWAPIEEHPDAGVRFLGETIPAFPRCVSTVLALHRKVPFARCVGWDVAVSAGETVRVMEWNAEHNDIKFSEATQGPCFADLGWEKLWRDLPGRRRTRAPVVPAKQEAGGAALPT